MRILDIPRGYGRSPSRRHGGLLLQRIQCDAEERVRFVAVSWERETYFTAVAVNKDGVIFLVESEGHDAVHDVLRNFDFLCAWHVDDLMDNSVVCHEGLECWIQVLLDKSTKQS